MSIKVLLAVKNYSKLGNKLEKLASVVKKPSIPMREAAIWITAQTIKAFEDGGRPEKWAPISIMTAFIRAKRESAPNTDPMPMNDTGRLKGGFLPVIDETGTQFGASNNVEYASLMQSGGLSEARTVMIGAFQRRRPGASVGLVRGKKKYTKGGPVSVSAYLLHLKGGSIIPARPFFPEGYSQLVSWGYQSKIKEIFAAYFNGSFA